MTNVTPGESVIEKPIERLPIAISVSGSYEQLSQFIRDVGKMSRIVTWLISILQARISLQKMMAVS